MRQEQRQKAMAYFARVQTPILVGRLASELGWAASLEQTEALLEEFVAEGVCRRLTADECRWFGISFGYAPV
jgi:hypothetical protein